MKKYLILLASLGIMFMLYSFGSLLKEHREAREAERVTQDIETYIERVEQCRLAFPRSHAYDIHMCAVD